MLPNKDKKFNHQIKTSCPMTSFSLYQFEIVRNFSQTQLCARYVLCIYQYFIDSLNSSVLDHQTTNTRNLSSNEKGENDDYNSMIYLSNLFSVLAIRLYMLRHDVVCVFVSLCVLVFVRVILS